MIQAFRHVTLVDAPFQKTSCPLFSYPRPLQPAGILVHLSPNILPG